MKVKFLKQKALYIDGAKLFDAGQEVDIPDAAANSLIHTKFAVEVKAEKAKQEPKKEVKQLKTKREDKQFKISEKEDK